MLYSPTDSPPKEKLDQLLERVQKISAMIERERARSPIVPLDDAARNFFQKKPSIVLGWARKGLIRAYAIPDGKRGYYYYFILDQLIEDIESNFSVY